METWIKADDIWSLWAIIVGWAAVSIYLEQKYRWAAKVSVLSTFQDHVRYA